MLAIATLAESLTVRADSAARVRRIGWLTLVMNYGPSGNRALNRFRDKLAELGWIEGRNFVIEPRWADNDRTRLPSLAAELVALNVDVIVTQTDAATLAAAAATRTIPIVATGAGELVATGVASSFAHPGGNVTGVLSRPGAGFATKVAQLLRDLAPRASRLAILGSEATERELESAAGALGIQVIPAGPYTRHDVPALLDRLARDRADSLLVEATSANDPNRRAIASFALARSWPSIGVDRTYPEQGGLMSYGPDWERIRDRTAVQVDRILRGAKPADVPLERPVSLQLVLNLGTAARLGLAPSAAQRLRADELIG